jgi:hypothetical protein
MKNKRSKTNTTLTSQTVNIETGEVIETTNKTISFEREPDFIKLYLDDMTRILDLNLSEQKTMFALLRKMNYDCEIILTTLIRKDLLNVLKMPLNTFKHSIANLVEKGIMLRKANNHYLVNPRLFARGSWNDIQKIRMSVIYSPKGKMVYTDFDYQGELPFDMDNNKEIKIPDKDGFVTDEPDSFGYH